MLQNILKKIDRIKPFPTVSAHCDIPCGIYNPDDALQAAKTMLKMVQKIKALTKNESKMTIEDRNNVIRMVLVKEEHSRKCKHELLTLWTDYFKPEHLEKLPDLHEKVWKTAKLVSKVKQSLNEDAAKELVTACEGIGKMFEKVEGAPKKE